MLVENAKRDARQSHVEEPITEYMTAVVSHNVGPQPSPPKLHSTPVPKGGGIINAPGCTARYCHVEIASPAGTGVAAVERIEVLVEFQENHLSGKLTVTGETDGKRTEMNVLSDSGSTLTSVSEARV